jgi:hypothetical protein
VERAGGAPIDRETFWTEIPGSNFYIPADKILNMNIRFPLTDDELTNYITKLLKGVDLGTEITATYDDPKEPPAADSARSGE